MSDERRQHFTQRLHVGEGEIGESLPAAVPELQDERSQKTLALVQEPLEKLSMSGRMGGAIVAQIPVHSGDRVIPAAVEQEESDHSGETRFVTTFPFSTFPSGHPRA